MTDPDKAIGALKQLVEHKMLLTAMFAGSAALAVWFEVDPASASTFPTSASAWAKGISVLSGTLLAIVILSRLKDWLTKPSKRQQKRHLRKLLESLNAEGRFVLGCLYSTDQRVFRSRINNPALANLLDLRLVRIRSSVPHTIKDVNYKVDDRVWELMRESEGEYEVDQDVIQSDEWHGLDIGRPTKSYYFRAADPRGW